MTIEYREKIEAAQKELDEIITDTTAMVELAEIEERDLSEDEDTQIEMLSEKAEKLKSRIESLTRAEKTAAMRNIEKAAPSIIHHRGDGRKTSDTNLFIKQGVLSYLSHVENKSIDQVMQERYRDDDQLQAVVKSAVEPAQTSVAGWAQELTDEANRGFQDLLRGVSTAADAMSNAGMQFTFDRLSAINVPKRAGGKTDVAPSWTGEGDAIPVKRATTGTIRLEPYKWAVIVTLTKEMAARSTPALEGLIQQFILADAGTQLDANYWNANAAVAGYSPAGILVDATSTPASTIGTPAEDINNDLKALLDPIFAADMGRNIRLYMHDSNALAISMVQNGLGNYMYRDEMSAGRLLGYPFVASTNVPIDVLIAQDCAELASSIGGTMFDTSDVATLVQVNDDGVQPDMSAGASPRTPNTGAVSDAAGTTPPSPVRSLWQTNTIGVKMHNYISWKDMRAGSVSVITGVDY
jgi:HK97 family phage major capsid protein